MADYVVPFAKVERFTGWGKAILDTSDTVNVRLVSFSATGHHYCASCRDKEVRWWTRVAFKRMPPKGYMPTDAGLEFLVEDNEARSSPDDVKLRVHSFLCGNCVEKRLRRYSTEKPSDDAEDEGNEPADEIRAPFLSNEPVPLKPQAKIRDEDVAPMFSGMAIRIGDNLAARLALTPHRPDAKPIGEAFSVLIVKPLGPLALIRMVGTDWKAYGESGQELDLDDAREPVLRNIGYGACDLLAEQREPKPTVHREEPKDALPVKLIKPTHEIDVELGADFREIVIEILEGKRQYETATTEAIFVRGHWTHQPCGEGGSQRKLIWRQPHYRGKGQRGGRTYELKQES